MGGGPSLIGPEPVGFMDINERPPEACRFGPAGRVGRALSVMASPLSEFVRMCGGCARGDDVFGTFDITAGGESAGPKD